MKATLSALLGAVIGVSALLGIQAASAPWCPTEDSCGYAWDHGHGRTVEVQP